MSNRLVDPRLQRRNLRHRPVEKVGNGLPTIDTASGDRFVFGLGLENGRAQLAGASDAMQRCSVRDFSTGVALPTYPSATKKPALGAGLGKEETVASNGYKTQSTISKLENVATLPLVTMILPAY